MMDPASAHIKRADLAKNRRISFYKDELVKVQNLYNSRRYKQCIALCDQLQRTEIHALYQTFLWFYHAISYESIGRLAHNFSQNKLRFLDSAKESFSSALACLPLPYLSTETGAYKQSDGSPFSNKFSSPRADKFNLPSGGLQMIPVTPNRAYLQPSQSLGSIYSVTSLVNTHVPPGDEEVSPPKLSEDGGSVADTDGVEQKDIQDDTDGTTPKTPVPHNTRLKRAFSSPQVLQEDLVPSPLFSRNAKTARLPTPSPIDAVVTRPLPPLPFHHDRSNFKIQGTRITQDPFLRKTAVQTLIACFEGILPLPRSTSFTAATATHFSLSLPPVTPPGILTPRFRMIRDAFSPDPHNEHLGAYLSSSSYPPPSSIELACYNSHLADFRAQLRKHIASVDVQISQVHKLQTERNAARSLGPSQRLASFWSFDAAASASPATGKPSPYSRGRNRGDDKDDSQASPGPFTSHDTKSKSSKQERIERLRRQGWNVRKENHGFKGVAFYDDLCARVEAELAGAALMASRRDMSMLHGL